MYHLTNISYQCPVAVDKYKGKRYHLFGLFVPKYHVPKTIIRYYSKVILQVSLQLNFSY